MKLTRPTQNVFYISVIIAIVALLANNGSLNLGISGFLLMTIAYILLLAGVVFKGF